ncbi:hypothetical protein MTR_8g088920 [Medicago truncatula]|uniref:Uncharacterized protein n=1 Tax=Medicago truncatula TaxID=3880 RepID=G7L8W5_MEDTR|nr:hypothetical protein MTR_8g088920 [Medicago truncatula]
MVVADAKVPTVSDTKVIKADVKAPLHYSVFFHFNSVNIMMCFLENCIHFENAQNMGFLGQACHVVYTNMSRVVFLALAIELSQKS